MLGWLVSKAVDVRSTEIKALCWAWLYSWSLLLAYYVLRPIRDAMGSSGGVHNLPWLFACTLITMLALNPIFAWLINRWPRERFVAIAYRFFELNLVLFILALWFASPEQFLWIGRVFFVWVSVFNLFVVSVFWSLVDDVFTSEQGKRLFGFIAAGATLGGVVGSLMTYSLVGAIGQPGMLMLAIVLLELAVLASKRLLHHSSDFNGVERTRHDEQVASGSVLEGLKATFKSPYLLGIGGYILLYSITSTFLYFQQAQVASSGFSSEELRVRFFANIDLWANMLTLILQIWITGRLTKWLGVGVVIALLPLVSMIGFSALLLWPTAGALMVVQVLRRVSNFAFARPAREVLFTVIPREERYKAKNFIDTVVYRSGDQLGSWSYALLSIAGLGIAGISATALPIVIGWLCLSGWLGYRQKRAEGEVG